MPKDTASKFPYTTIAMAHEAKGRLSTFASKKDESFEEIVVALMDFAEKNGWKPILESVKVPLLSLRPLVV